VFPNKEVDMSHRSSAGARQPALLPDHPMDSEEVLDTLRVLIQQVSSPVVQECLRAARCEIAFLTSTEGKLTEAEDGEDGPDEEEEGWGDEFDHAEPPEESAA